MFSFRGYEGIDSRENYGEHDIKIVGVDEVGSVDYIVYGYMNRGIHEGKSELRSIITTAWRIPMRNWSSFRRISRMR